MLKNHKKSAVIVGLGALVACSVCLIPLALPLLLGSAAVGTFSAGYWITGAALLLLAGLIALLKSRWLTPRGRDCCSPK